MTRFAKMIVLRAALGGAFVTSAALTAPIAHASVSIAVQFDELVEKSKAVAVVVPVEQRSLWEGQFIITYTKVHVEDALAGDANAGQEVWIVTRGGTVGDIGQSVDGEPTFHVGRPSLAFLREDIIDDKAAGASGVYVVTGRAQGQFPLQDGEAAADGKRMQRVVSHPGVGLLLPPKVAIPALPKPLAREVLEGKTVDEARAAIAASWRKLHPGAANVVAH